MKIVEKENIKDIVKVLKEDGIIAYPTDTVYGLAVRYSSNKAKERLIHKKNRPLEKSFPIMVSDIEMLKEIAIVNNRDEKIINALMPGPLTIILNKKDNNTIAIRMASDKYIKEIIDILNEPIYLTSANKSDENVLNNEEEILKANLSDLIVKGIPGRNRPSTIVDLSKDEIIIIREGPISREEILNVI